MIISRETDRNRHRLCITQFDTQTSYGLTELRNPTASAPSEFMQIKADSLLCKNVTHSLVWRRGIASIATAFFKSGSGPSVLKVKNQYKWIKMCFDTRKETPFFAWKCHKILLFFVWFFFEQMDWILTKIKRVQKIIIVKQTQLVV